jgi:hypothetical protein
VTNHDLKVEIKLARGLATRVRRRRLTRKEKSPLMTTFKTTSMAISPRSVTASLMIKIRRSSEVVPSISLETSPQEAAEVAEVAQTEEEEVAEAALSEIEEAEVAVVEATEVAEGAAEEAAEVVEVEVTSHLLQRTVNSRSSNKTLQNCQS